MKRQLPQWMLGVPLNSTIDSNSNNSCNKDIEDETAAREPKGLKKRKQSGHNDRTNDIDSGITKRERNGVKNKSKQTVEPIDCVKGKPPRSVLVKCSERKRNRESLSLCDGISKNERNYTKAKKHVRLKNDEDDVASIDCLDEEEEDDDDGDLTMEDLMIIANEYVQEDTLYKFELSKEKPMSVNQSDGIANSDGINPTVSRITESTERNYSYNPTTSVINSFECNMSENPTQSMLDVFLGPLLKKTQTAEKEKRIESKTSDLDMKFEAYKRKSIPVEEKGVTTTTMVKKKSSLKEKVMMFLD